MHQSNRLSRDFLKKCWRISRSRYISYKQLQQFSDSFTEGLTLETSAKVVNLQCQLRPNVWNVCAQRLHWRSTTVAPKTNAASCSFHHCWVHLCRTLRFLKETQFCSVFNRFIYHSRLKWEQTLALICSYCNWAYSPIFFCLKKGV